MKTQPRNARIIVLCLFLTAGTSTAELRGPSGTIQQDDAHAHSLLVIYDVLGREIATIVDRDIEAGTYVVEWKEGNFPSGMYICRLTYGGLTQVRKMQILK
jgi:hypothetical protein